jgi:S-DNA-T family DNA segregation ATPase FtsK/SpoIIIE
MHRVVVGPTVIRFELEPEGDVRCRDYSRLGRADDLRRALKTPTLRISAPIPGTGLIGIEIAATRRRVVGLGEVAEVAEAPLRAALGLTVDGEPLSLDLRALPHLAVAGASGSGKTSLLHSLICSLLMSCTPDELALVLCDVKMVELSRYRGVPHLYGPPAISVEAAMVALDWLVDEVQARFSSLSEHGCQDLTEYNARDDVVRLPYVLCVIDELADLMMRSRERVETAVVRLGQLGRACGVHLCVASQSPHREVFSGLIKANCVGRIALKTVSGVHSRVAIDQGGAEALLGQGDGLLQDGTSTVLRRFQSAYIAKDDIARICDHWHAQDVVEQPEETVPIVEHEPEQVLVVPPDLRRRKRKQRPTRVTA